jgi:hypothetical protein
MSAVKRGVAVGLAARVAATTGAHVCLVGADPTDRDVERRTADLVAAARDYRRTEMRRGPHTLHVTVLPDERLAIATLSDRTVVEEVVPFLRQMFSYVVIDAPSGVGGGVGIAHVLPKHLDGLVVVSGLRAGELALTRAYVEALGRKPAATHADVRVVTTGDEDESGLTRDQLRRKYGTLPFLGGVPRLDRPPATEEVDAAFAPIVSWVRAFADVAPGDAPAPGDERSQRHRVVARRYRDNEP